MFEPEPCEGDFCGCRRPQPVADTVGSGANSTASTHEKEVRFAECLRDNGGRDVQDPTAVGPLIHASRIPSAAARGAHSVGRFGPAEEHITTSSSELPLGGE